MKVYFDACCLNRPFDDQTQERIRLETEALNIVWALMKKNRHVWISSDVIEDEILAASDPSRRDALINIASGADLSLKVTEKAVSMAKFLWKNGFPAQDALHLAVALEGGCDVFLTVDDRLTAKSRRHRPPLGMKVINPLTWIGEGMKS